MALCLHFTSLYLKNILSLCYVLYLKPRWYHKLPQEAFSLLEAPKSSSPAPSRPAFRRESKLRLRQSLGGAVGLSRFQQGWGMSSNTPCTPPDHPRTCQSHFQIQAGSFFLLRRLITPHFPTPAHQKIVSPVPSQVINVFCPRKLIHRAFGHVLLQPDQVLDHNNSIPHLKKETQQWLKRATVAVSSLREEDQIAAWGLRALNQDNFTGYWIGKDSR